MTMSETGTQRKEQRTQRRTRAGVIVLAALASVSFAGTFASLSPVAHGQMTSAPSSGAYKREPGTPSSVLPRPLREIGFDQNLDRPIPLDVAFRDESGRDVRIGDYFGKRPVVLVFAYYDCPMLCTQVLNGLASALNVLSLTPGK